MMKWGITVLLSAVLFMGVFATEVFAEYYQYTDEDGVVHFTDDLSNVPAKRILGVRSFQSIDSIPRRRANVDEFPEAVLNRPAPSETWDGRMRTAINALDAEKAELDNIFKELQKQKADLGQKDLEIMAPEKRRIFEDQIRKLNQRINRYNKRHNDFMEKMSRVESRYADL